MSHAHLLGASRVCINRVWNTSYMSYHSLDFFSLNFTSQFKKKIKEAKEETTKKNEKQLFDL